MAPADSEAQSLRESFGVRAAYVSWIVRGFDPHTSHLGTKSTLLLQNRGHAEVLKKDPFLCETRNEYASPPPPVPECPPPPPPSPRTKILASAIFSALSISLRYVLLIYFSFTHELHCAETVRCFMLAPPTIFDALFFSWSFIDWLHMHLRFYYLESEIERGRGFA